MSVNVVLSNTGPFCSGAVIAGHIECIFSSEEEIRGITLKLRGLEHTTWVKTVKRGKEKRRVRFSGDNNFCAIDQTIQGNCTINAGRHEYPLQFTLPNNLPSSYKGAYGHIRYYLKATVDRPWAIDYESETEFVVHSPVDLNGMLDSIVLNPTQYSERKTLCCGCWADDPITMEVNLEKEAFILGEKIKLKVDITNMSNQPVARVDVKLEKLVREICTHPHRDRRDTSDTILHISDTGVGAHGQRSYNFELEIPINLELPNFVNCQLFELFCILKIKAVIPGCHTNIRIKTVVNLGHIPIRGYQPNVEEVNNIVTPSPQVYPPPVYSNGNTSLLPPLNNSTGVGFIVPVASVPPYPPSALYPTASAPSDETAPSAPSIDGLPNYNNIGEGSSVSDPPPPSYSEAVRIMKQ